METASRSQPAPWVAAALVGTLSATLGLITVGRKSLWFDEAFDAEHINDGWHSVSRLIAQTEMTQAAYLIALKTWASVTPSSDAWLRVPSVVLAALAAALLVPLGTRLLDRTSGIVAGLLLATNAFVVQWSQQARTYGLAVLAAVVLTTLFARALDDPTRRRSIIYGAGAGLAVYCHFFVGFVIAAHLLSLPFAPTRPSLRRALEAGTTFLLVSGPALYFAATATRVQLDWIPKPSLDAVGAVLHANIGYNLGLAVAAIAGLVVLTLRTNGGNAADRWRLALIGGWCALPILLGFAVSLVQPILIDHYAIVMTPGIALAGAAGITALAARRRALAIGAVAILLAVSGYRTVEWYGKGTDDWRGAAAFIAGARAPGDAVVVVPWWAAPAYRHYDPTPRLAVSEQTDRAYLALYIDTKREASDLATDAVDPTRFELERELVFGEHVVVHVYERRK